MSTSYHLFKRHLGLLSKDQYEIIASKRLLVVGCGLGSLVSSAAVRLGFHNLTIVDGDVVEESNLNRQEYTLGDVGKPKVKALKEKLVSINNDAKISEVDTYVTLSNIDDLIKDIDIIVDTIDPLQSPEVVVELHKKAALKKIPIVFPVDIGWGGGIYVFSEKSSTLEEMLGASTGTEKQDLRSRFIAYYLGIIPEYFQAVIGSVVEGKIESIPQPTSAAYVAASLSVIALKRIALGLPIKLAPNFISFDPSLAHESE